MDDKQLDLKVTLETDSHLYEQVGNFLDSSKRFAKKQLDTTIITTYFEVDRMIVVREQKGAERAKDGTKLLQGLAEFGELYITDGSSLQKQQTLSAEFKLDWSQC